MYDSYKTYGSAVFNAVAHKCFLWRQELVNLSKSDLEDVFVFFDAALDNTIERTVAAAYVSGFLDVEQHGRHQDIVTAYFDDSLDSDLEKQLEHLGVELLWADLRASANHQVAYSKTTFEVEDIKHTYNRFRNCLLKYARELGVLDQGQKLDKIGPELVFRTR